MQRFSFWNIDGNYAVHRDTGYECYLLANLGDNITWVDHIAGKPWATPGALAELRHLLGIPAEIAS